MEFQTYRPKIRRKKGILGVWTAKIMSKPTCISSKTGVFCRDAAATEVQWRSARLEGGNFQPFGTDSFAGASLPHGGRGADLFSVGRALSPRTLEQQN